MSDRRLRVFLLVFQSLGLFALLNFYIGLRIRPELFYHQQPQVFLFDSRFFHDLVGRPGGVVDYLAALLSPLLVWDWLGALVLAILVTLICLATRGLIVAVAEDGGEFFYLVPAVLILMMLGQYSHPVGRCVGLGIALLGANVYFRLGGFHVVIRSAAFLVASVAIHYSAAGMYLIFACLCGVYELGVKRRYGVGALFMVCAVLIPLAATAWPFHLILGDAFRGLLFPREQHWQAIPTSTTKNTLIWTASLAYPLVVVIAFARLRKPSAESVRDEETSSGRMTTSTGARALSRLKKRPRLVVPLVFLLLLLLADLTGFDESKRCLLEVEANSEQQRWDQVLAWAEKLPLTDTRARDPRILYCINRALYFKGTLLDRMFAYPQTLDTPSLALVYEDTAATAQLTPRQCSEIFFDLGRINESEHMAYEALEVCGNRPDILKRLAWIYVIREQPEAARRFLSMLECSLLHGDWARRVRAELDADPSLSGIPVIVWRRELMIRRDSLNDADDLERLLGGLLERNPRNRMAIEYLTAHYLLTRQLDKLAAVRHQLDARDDHRFPRHVEEALVCYMATAEQSNLDLGERAIRPERWREFERFLRIERQTRGDASVAFAALYPDFGSSYFFSYVFGHNIPSLGISRPPK